MWRLVLLMLVLASAAGSASCQGLAHRIGVLTRDGEEDTRERWTATAEYLEAHLPGETFVVVPLRHEALGRAVAYGQVAFVVTNAGQYVELAVRYGTAALATMQRDGAGVRNAMAGAAIIARADRPDIMWMADLKGKSFMAVGRDAFAGFEIAWWELRAHDIEPFRDFSRLVFSGVPAERIVEAVRDGTIDGAAVRTDVLDRMIAAGTVDPRWLRVLHPRAETEHGRLRSTDVYPEWAFAATRETPPELARRVSQALWSMAADEPAARAASYVGWTAPLDYDAVREVLRDLKLPPYEALADMTVVAFAKQHWTWLVLALTLVLVMAATLIHVARLNYRLNMSRRSLERVRAAEAHLAHVGRLAAMGEMATTLAHELNQPLAAIANYANGSIRRLKSDALDARDLQNVLERIAAESNRSAEIIRRVREFLRDRKPLHQPENVNRIVCEAAGLLRPAAQRHRVSVQLALADALPPVEVDAVQIQQVIVNLVQNAIDAIAQADSVRREVTIATERAGPRSVRLSVSDTGPGIAAELGAVLFKPFTTTKLDGMGLGLSISHSIVEAHGGRLRVATDRPGGTAFEFTLSGMEGA